MPIKKLNKFLSLLIFLQGCSYINSKENVVVDSYQDKAYFNQEWQKQGVSKEEWYYRLTVIDAPINTRAMSIGDGHWLHPETIRWEITKDLLIGWRPEASMLGAENEFRKGVREHYRGAPVVAFAITAHGDIKESQKKPWYERQYMHVDWSRNVISSLARRDFEDGIESFGLHNSTTHVVDNSFIGNPKRARFSKSHMEFVTRHPVEVSKAAAYGLLIDGLAGESAAPVIDVRHAFLKKTPSDFVPLPYPNQVVQVDSNEKPILGEDKKAKLVAISDRFGVFRTGHFGRKVYDWQTGASGGSIVNATIFNIWQKSRDEQGSIIPMEQRQVKPIIYYTNVLHPNDLNHDSQQVAKEWDMAFRAAVFYAQPGKYQSIDLVPSMWILKENDCSLNTVEDWLTHKISHLKESVEEMAHVKFKPIKDELDFLYGKDCPLNFNDKTIREIEAKRQLEQICSSLEYHTENSTTPFIYQRAGDMRFNLINLEVSNNITAWSGYGPMISDNLTGETISATANVNLKYINEKAQKISKLMGLLRLKNASLQAVFGSGADSFGEETVLDARKRIQYALSSANIGKSPQKNQTRQFFADENLGFSQSELAALAQIKIEKEKVSHQDHKNEMLRDSISFIDTIALQVAFKFAKLPEETRFLKIRSAIYKAVALHEIGHNMGLEHNMQASADAINYGDHFWWIQDLPQKIEEAIAVVHDSETKEKLHECLLENKQFAEKIRRGPKDKEWDAQDCLQQKTGMYASIMDYHASALANIQGLGLYDKAAIKWVYAQIVETFPKANLAVDSEKTELSTWLKYNDYRLIPSVLLRNSKAINDRHHAKFTWTSQTATLPFPSTVVPYMFCNDPSGMTHAKCAAFDFGPDMETSALWLKSRFWNQYLLNHFAKDSLNTRQASLDTVKGDIDILDRYTNILRWYYKNLHDDKDFAGSFLEKDYLKAIAIGMNHFAHVLGLSNSGGFVSAPNWTLEEKRSAVNGDDRLNASMVFVPFKDLSVCEAKSLTNVNERGEIKGVGNFEFVNVPLGVGRPGDSAYSFGLHDSKFLYSGTNIIKKYAILLLSSPILDTASALRVEQKEWANMSWYTLFPQAVGKLLGAVINRKYEDLGPIVNNNGIIPRDVIDERTLKVIDYHKVKSVMATSDGSLPMMALASAVTFLPDNLSQSAPFIKALQIACKGCNNERGYGDLSQNEVSYVHLSGQEYKAAKIENVDSVGANLLNDANTQKNIYLNLVKCIDNEDYRNTEPFCQCIKIVDRQSFDDWECCSASNPNCPKPELEPIGAGTCSLRDLEVRKNKALESLDSMVGFIDEIRRLVTKSNNFR